MLLLPSLSTHFPYTTLFRSLGEDRLRVIDRGLRELHLRERFLRGLGGRLGLTEHEARLLEASARAGLELAGDALRLGGGDRKSTRLNSSHGYISYAVFCLKK